MEAQKPEKDTPLIVVCVGIIVVFALMGALGILNPPVQNDCTLPMEQRDG